MHQYQMDLKSFNIRPYRSKRLVEYSKRMSTDDLKVIYDDNVADMLKAQGFSVEDAPRSIYHADKLYEALSKYAPKYAHDLSQDEHIRHGIALARICFSRPQDEEYLECLPMTPMTILGTMSNPSGSAGLTQYGSTKAESHTRALERGLQTMIGQKAPEPCLAFKRTQFNEKTRLVWGYPYSMTAIESLVGYPLLEKFKGGGTPMAFAMTTGALGTKLRVASYHKRWAYSIDFSAFDATIPAKLIDIAFDIMSTWYRMDEIEPISGKTVKDIINLVRTYFIKTPIVMPDMNLYLGKRHGVPSGSLFTQLVDSIVNVIVCGAISSRFSMHVERREIFVLGDDLLMWSNRLVDLDNISNYVLSAFKMIVGGKDKSRVYRYDQAVHYLGRDWPNGLPTLDLQGITARMSFPERHRKYSKDPKVKEREVRLLILSYAAVYYGAWQIAQKLLGSDLWFAQGPERVDGPTYGNASDGIMVNVDHLSGLMRFRAKYGDALHPSGLTTTAMSYWL